jgi:hypothetical protein
MATHLAAAVQQYVEEQGSRRLADRATPPFIPVNYSDERASTEYSPGNPKFYGMKAQKGRPKRDVSKQRGPNAANPCRGCGSPNHWLRDGVCKGKDVADFLRRKLESNAVAKVMHELLLPEDSADNLARDEDISEGDSVVPEHDAHFVLQGGHEQVEDDEDFRYEALLAKEIQSHLATQMSKLDAGTTNENSPRGDPADESRVSPVFPGA